jgi:flagellar motility protein MotE (MotC chaperone)
MTAGPRAAAGAAPVPAAPDRPARHRKRRFLGTLWVLAALLGLSAVTRVVLGFDAARAVVAPEAPGAVAEPPSCGPLPAELAHALTEREERLAVREAALEARLSALELVERAVAGRLATLEAAEAQLAATLALAERAAEDDLARLTAVYEAMKPKDAAALFETMSTDFAAGFLGRMRPEAAAAVLSGMSAEAAYAISVLIAARNAGAPTE